MRASEAYIRDGGWCNKSAYRYLALFSAGGSKGLGSGVEKNGQKGQLCAITMRLRGREKLKWGERNKRNRVDRGKGVDAWIHLCHLRGSRYSQQDAGNGGDERVSLVCGQ